MLTLIRNGHLYTPQDIGKKDILLAGNKIVKIDKKITISGNLDIDIVDAKGKILLPGLVDLHVHITGGGGEGGPATHAPEIQLSQITLAGVTTVLGVLGTDSITRSLESLLSKAMALESEGITAFIVTGSYHLPPVTLTGSVRKDITLFPHVLGTGEIAIADHRSSQPRFEEFASLVAESRVGGMLGGKSGLVIIHMGSGDKKMEYLFRLAAETEIPIQQVLPTHITRSESLLNDAIRFAKMGGNIDITASDHGSSEDISALDAICRAIAEGVSIDQITISSDANGSSPIFDSDGNLESMAICDIGNLWAELIDLIEKDKIPIEQVLKCFTINPARQLKIEKTKGTIEEGKDADLLILSPDWELDRVYAKGRLMVSDRIPIVRGTFE